MKNLVSIHELLAIIEHTEGWLSPHEQVALLHLPSMVDHLNGDIVEIGSYKGKSTIALALGSSLMSKKKRPIYAIDPFLDYYYPSFQFNINYHRLQYFIIPIKQFSTQAYDDCPKSIAALFIDGDHEYSSVKHDITHYVSRVVNGGLILFHDYTEQFPGVIKAVNELCNNSEYNIVLTYDHLIIVRKTNN